MAVINLNIIESEEQIVAGIPFTVTMSTNVPSSIFYTLDGSIPTLFSDIYTGPILLPYDVLVVILNVFATNGIDSSPVVTETYMTNMLDNVRLSHSATTDPPKSSIPDLYPFGTSSPQPNSRFLSPGDAGINVDDPSLPTISSGYDADGYQALLSNQEFNQNNYQIIYNTRDAEGQPQIGSLPPVNSTIESPVPAPEYTNQFTKMFDPRAFVIFQDFTQSNSEDLSAVNRQFFTLEDPDRARDGNAYFTSGLDAPPVSGSFLRAHHNPKDNTITYYYLDTWTNRWIISKTKYQPKGSFNGDLSGKIVAGKGGTGSRFVYEWIPYSRRVLF
jgi:Chitobiase/beta-hexosaminidase C-terminal domain